MPSEREKALEAALRDALDNGLIYWEPNTERGYVSKTQMLNRIDQALAIPADASAVGEAAPFEQSGLYGEYTPVTIGPSPATHAESLLAEAVGMLERVPGALNGMFSAGMEEREGGSARRQERYAKAGDALKAEIPAFLAKIKEKQDADA